jgi:hypothetical protein
MGNPRSMPRNVDGFPASHMTKREEEREAYLSVHRATFGEEEALARWARYEQLILKKYGYGGGRLDAAWKNRDRAHSSLVR